MSARFLRAGVRFSDYAIFLPALLRSKNHLKRDYFTKVATPAAQLFSKYAGVPLYAGFLFGGITAEKAKMAPHEETIAKAEELYNAKDWPKLYEHLKAALEQEDNQKADVYWRMARACREMANSTADKEKKKEFTFEAFGHSTKGIELEPENPDCNKWQGILLELTARFEGIKKRIQNSYLVKEHLEKAIAKRPDDATVLHSLGVWCFEVSDLPWYQKKVASTFFAKPPESTYEEALKYFTDAEKVEANFYSHNLVYLGKTYMRLGKKEEAKKTFQQCLDNPVKANDDEEAKKEAAALLKKC